MVAYHIFLAAQDHRHALVTHFFAQEKHIFSLISDGTRAARAEIDGSAHELGGLVSENARSGDRALSAFSRVDGFAVEIVLFCAVKAIADIGREGALFACQGYGAVVVALRASQYNPVPAKICLITTLHPDIVVGQPFPGCLPELDQVHACALSEGDLVF